MDRAADDVMEGPASSVMRSRTMPHNQESARATVLTPDDEAKSSVRNPISQVQIVGGMIAAVVLAMLVLVTFLVV
jgi:hypothetical protein